MFQILSNILLFFINYFETNWASILTWGLVIIALICIRMYQLKWKNEKKLILLKHESTDLIVHISMDNLKNLKDQCDSLNELLESTDEKIIFNNSNVDKEVLELIYELASKSQQSRVKNVD